MSRRQAALNKSRQRNLRRAETWDGISDQEIYERDGWRCKLCRAKINPVFKYPDKRSKSIDHITPISAGGGDIAANKRAAHLGCNMRRGNQMRDDQLLLFGSVREPPVTPEIRGVVKAWLGEAKGWPRRRETKIYFYECRYCTKRGCQAARGNRREVCPDPDCQRQRLKDNSQVSRAS